MQYPLIESLIHTSCIKKSFIHCSSNIYFKGFYNDIDGGTYGTVRKGVKRPLSNFNFNFQKKIISSSPASTGYLVEVIPENVENDSDSDSEHVFSR